MDTPKDRLFRGYGPLIAFAAVFLSIAVLVPSVPRESRVDAVGGPEDAMTSTDDFVFDDEDFDPTEVGGISDTFDGSDLASELLDDEAFDDSSGSTGSRTNSNGSTSGGGTNASGGNNQSGGGQPGNGASQAAGGAQNAGPTRVGACDDRPLQIPHDPYSPPCIEFSGSNGGATSMGVHGDRIVVSVRLGGFANGMLDALSKVAKAKIPTESPDVIVRTIEGLTEYFNRTFQMYGRKFDVIIYDGKGDVLKEITGGGQEAAESDALHVQQEIKAFADVSAVSPVYADALARRKIINIGAPFMSRQWLSQRRPYIWSQFIDCSTAVESVASYYLVKLNGKNADFAGGDLKGKPRRTGLIAPENSWYQECVNSALAMIQQAGGDMPVLNEKYRIDINTMSIQAGEKIAKLKNAGATTVICGCDPLLMTFLTAKAREQNYHPEWIITGLALIDQDLIGSIMEPSQWSRSFGISFSGPSQAAGQGLGYRAYKSVRREEPSVGVELIYNQLHLLAIGVQMAGPNLTPASFEQGMFRYPTRTGPFGTWTFGPNDYSTSQDAREIFWNPSARSPETRDPGTYVDPNGGRRFPIGRWPNTPPQAAG